MLVKDTGVPVVGLWRLRLVKRGPWVAVRIFDEAERDEAGDLLEDEKLRCVVDGNERDPWKEAESINLHGRPIDQAEYDHILNVKTWAVEHAPDQPEAAPRTPIDLNKTPVIF